MTMFEASLVPSGSLGQKFEVVDVIEGHPAARRLAELGVVPGRQLSLLCSGDPAIVSVAGSRFALDGVLQSCIYVEPREE